LTKEAITQVDESSSSGESVPLTQKTQPDQPEATATQLDDKPIPETPLTGVTQDQERVTPVTIPPLNPMFTTYQYAVRQQLTSI
jgi:hypothetical protein